MGIAVERRPARRHVLSRFLRSSQPLPVEVLLAGAVILIWQLARIPFEAPVAEAVSTSGRWLDAERVLGVAIEPAVVSGAYAHPDLLAALNWFYSHMDETLVLAALVTLRLVDPLRYPTVRTAFALAHLPALVVVTALPTAPPRWVPGFPHGRAPVVDVSADLRNSTAAAVSLHVGIPVMLAAAAVWMRPRAILARAAWLYPAAVATAAALAAATAFAVNAVVMAAG